MTLLFKRPLITKIRQGTKTQTRRLNKPRVKIGNTYHLRENYNTTLPDKIHITDIYQQYLGDITTEDIKQEGFTTQTEFKEIWAQIYGEYKPEEYIWVIEFRYLDSTETFKEKP